MKALALKPGWEEGWWSIGTIEYDQDRYASAALAFEKVIRLNPKQGTAHAMLGLCQFEQGKHHSALEHLLNAERLGVVKDERLRTVALYHLGVLELRVRQFHDAHETLRELAEQHVSTRELTIALGQSALLVQPQLAPPDGSPEASVVERAGQAEVFLATKDLARAKQTYQELISQFPEYPNLHFAYGRLLLEEDEQNAAVGEFSQELKRDPEHVNSLLQIALVRYRVDSTEGLRYAEQAVHLAPQMPFAHYLLGLLRLDTADAAGAIAEFEIARKSFPNEPQIYFSLGNAYAKLGRKEEAAKARAAFLHFNEKRQKPGSSMYGEVTPSRKLQTVGQDGANP